MKTLICLCVLIFVGCKNNSSSRVMTGSGVQPVMEEPSGDAAVVSARDLTYPPPEGVRSDLNTLDIFRIQDQQRHPIALLVHGGSWVSGDKAGFEQKIVPWWLEQGYAAVPVNFRLASRLNMGSEVQPRDQARDIAAALAWVISQADSYHLDTSKVVLMGYSSGAHLVALLSTDESILEEAGIDPNSVKGSISLDVHVYDVPYALGLMEGSVVEQNIPLILHLFGRSGEEQLKGSPINFVEGWASRSLIISVDQGPEEVGSHGYIVSRSAERYVEALRSAGHQADTLHDSSETHSSLVMGFNEPDDRVTEAIAGFVSSLN